MNNDLIYIYCLNILQMLFKMSIWTHVNKCGVNFRIFTYRIKKLFKLVWMFIFDYIKKLLFKIWNITFRKSKN
jgi:hypothetical protein